MLTRIAGGRIIDPANGRDEVGDIWMRDGRIVEPPVGARADATYDAAGKIVMAGAIDIHSHIAGWNVNTARLLLSEKREPGTSLAAAVPLARARSSTFETGCLYAAMGFTTVVEPAVSPHYALHAHLELADTPIIDKAILTILGNDDFCLACCSRRSGCGDRRLRGVDTRNVARPRHQGGQCRRRCGLQRQCAVVFIR